MSSQLPPLSYASIIVGFTSFAFTVFTFVRVFWETLQTLWSAPKEMERLLDNLRLELHGERAYFKSVLRRQRSRSKSMKLHLDLEPIRLLSDSVKAVMNDFKRLEEPFLNEPPEEKEKDVERSEESIRGDYAPMTLVRRWQWMQRKDDFRHIADITMRIQTRRIACDVANVLSKVTTVERTLEAFEDRLWDLEEHLMGERLDDGKVYVKRRADRTSKDS